jgi:diguanylate cyclase (GGDEF)-like protein
LALVATGTALLFTPLEPYRLVWLALLVAALGAYGLKPGLITALAVSGIDLLVHSSSQVFTLGSTLGLMAVAWSSDRLRRSLARASQQQAMAAGQLDLLVRALQVLSEISSREQVFETIPGLLGGSGEGNRLWLRQQGRLLSLPATHPGLDDARVHTAVHQAYQEQVVVYQVSDRTKQSHLALPLCQCGEVVAVLELRRTRPFLPGEREGYEHFARAVSDRLTWVAERAEAQLLNQLSTSLASAQSVSGVANRALALLTSSLGVQSGMILRQQGDQIRLVGSFGVEKLVDEAWLQQQFSNADCLIWEVYRTGRPVFVEDLPQDFSHTSAAMYLHRSLVVHPVALPGASRTRVMLCLTDPQPRQWLHSERELLARACRAVSLAMEGAMARERLETVLDLSRRASLNNSELLYHQVLSSAVELIPGAGAGSLLVRKGQRFYFQATAGYDLDSLTSVSFSEADHLRWYGGGVDAWQRGEARILSDDQVSIQEASARSASAPIDRTQVEQIRANLAVPILYQDEVLALLNLDNWHDSQAFGSDSLEAARFFATPVATLLHEAHTRQRLEEAALTDSLTGLANRRAFNVFIDRELIRSKRYGQPFSLLFLDLQGFKTINDQLGHAQGDQALVLVAHALRQAHRKSDGLFRFGGDEFAALLPQTSAEQAVQAAQRYASAIQQIAIEGLGLGVNIGVAAYPLDGTDRDMLMSLADERMYTAKNRKISIVHEPGLVGG